MLWLKAFHLVFVVAWFAGLFYLPRLFVYHAAATDEAGHARFCTMERRLFAIMTIGGVLAVVFGASMILTRPDYLDFRWMHAKLTLVALLVVYHVACYRLMVALRLRRGGHSSTWYRWFNEIPTLLLIGITILAVVKPF
jgi:putative membrane protein